MNIALPLLLVSACAAERQGVEEQQSALSTFVFDSTAIETHPEPTLPAARLSPRAYDVSIVAKGLVHTGEPLALNAQVGSRKLFDSPSWSVETDDSLGSALAVTKLAPGAAVTVDEQQLPAQSIERLAGWGLPRTEIASVVQRRLMNEDDDAAAVAAPALHRYKTFVMRGFNGVPVTGHRAVVSYDVDGRFARAYIAWPALAEAGHRLRTALTTPQIEAAAADALLKEGESGGNVKLRWKYVPTPSVTGAAGVTLTLMVGAHTQPARNPDGALGERREIDVDVRAQ